MDDVSISEGSDEDVEDERVSETWLQDNDNDLEDGEFRSEGAPVVHPEKMKCHDGTEESLEVLENNENVIMTIVDPTVVISQVAVKADNPSKAVGIPQVLSKNANIGSTTVYMQ